MIKKRTLFQEQKFCSDYADDIMLFSVVQDPYISAADFNDDLKTISQWSHQWKMGYNPVPNKQAAEMLFSRNKK